ncbi:MAG: hypothetical protein NTW06_04745 [Candidatus Falkowbacteria bacterium]|nr:hypothetical protein [Candidatus Falkowbacteria bacterium]
MSHQCKAILIHCMDFRLIKETTRWMIEKDYLGDCDVISLAGASKELIDGDEGASALILKQIELAHALHGANEVVLIHHSDCGAYKNSYNFASAAEEEEKQYEHILKTEGLIRSKFVEMKVTKIWAKMIDEHGEKVRFEAL